MTDTIKQPRVLIAEDQKYPLMALEEALNTIMPKYHPGFCNSDYDVAKCYNDTLRRVSEKGYDIVLLDHIMPYEDQGDLENRDMKRFSDNLYEVGYSLIPEIKRRSPSTIVIGTSSLSKGELRGTPAPDFTMSKMWGEAEEELEKILKQVYTGASK